MYEFKIVIAGGREFNDYTLLKQEMDNLIHSENLKNVCIISGGARGADYLGEKYAKERGYKLLLYPAEWGRYGKSAGYIRNKEMADASDATVAFWDGESKGTKHMIDITKSVGNKIKVIFYQEPLPQF